MADLPPDDPPRPLRGFARMDPERRRHLASVGGKAAHASGHAYRFTSEAARVAGRQGGLSLAEDREHMRRIGRQGGLHQRRRSDPLAATIEDEDEPPPSGPRASRSSTD